MHKSILGREKALFSAPQLVGIATTLLYIACALKLTTHLPKLFFHLRLLTSAGRSVMSSSFTALVTPSSDHLCYIPCNFCNILLAVNVPSSSMLETVTVRCERCTNMSSVNMAASIRSISMPEFQVPKSDYGIDVASTSKTKNKIPMRAQTVNTIDRMVNRLPEKRQRVPSAYNQFIKEEIQRIKANNSGISHREAFSTAAKNWAHFPHTHYGLMLETTNKQPRLDTNSEKRSSMSMPALFK